MAANDREVSEIINQLKSGILLTKQKHNGKKFRRRFFLHEREGIITYEGSRKIFGKARTYSIGDIDEIRAGYKTQVFHNLLKKGSLKNEDGVRAFSILYDNHRKAEHLIAPDGRSRDLWAKGLQHLMERHGKKGQGHLMREENWILNFFHAADKDHSKSLSKKECRALLRDSFHVEMPDHIFEQMFRDADKNGEGTLSPEEFLGFFQLLTRRKDLYEIMQRFSQTGRQRSISEMYWDMNELVTFLNFTMLVPETQQQVQALVKEYELNRQYSDNGLISIDGFRNLLLSEHFNIIDPTILGKIYQDMTRPLCDYYINTSHNTYLFYSQLSGAANPEAYSRVLLMGGRAVELDCYDGDANGPIVKHAFTLVKSCTFESIIRCMEPNLFKASPYPVILNIENHCSSAQQKIMARILKDILGQHIVTQPISGRDRDSLPSPKDLMHKVLVRSKKTSDSKAKAIMKGQAYDDDDSIFNPLSRHVEPELSELFVYLQNVPYREYDYAKIHYTGFHSTSLEEKNLIKHSEEEPVELVQQTTWRILRSYPGGLRQDSSNPDPVKSWNVGVQMVAVNYQNSDDEMALYYGKFLENGGCGYVLKPDYLRNAHQTRFNPHDPPSNVDQYLIMTITVISGQFLPRSNLKTTDIPDPYIQVTTRGVPCDDKVEKTRTIDNNGFDPIWNETFEFHIKFPQMCLLYFAAIDYDPMSKDDRMAYFCAPVNMIRPGYRHINLKDNKNDSTYSTLFVHIDIRSAVEDEDAIVYTKV